MHAYHTTHASASPTEKGADTVQVGFSGEQSPLPRLTTHSVYLCLSRGASDGLQQSWGRKAAGGFLSITGCYLLQAGCLPADPKHQPGLFAALQRPLLGRACKGEIPPEHRLSAKALRSNSKMEITRDLGPGSHSTSP